MSLPAHEHRTDALPNLCLGGLLPPEVRPEAETGARTTVAGHPSIYPHACRVLGLGAADRQSEAGPLHLPFPNLVYLELDVVEVPRLI